MERTGDDKMRRGEETSEERGGGRKGKQWGGRTGRNKKSMCVALIKLHTGKEG